ncbi:MAG TPA: ATP-dependent zinc metalloprotease FtsH [Gemmataceae bacterium]|nr:ATP-dependent zinc metalloprotease FtsH [Gemmataceae bacterium]
MPPRTPPPSPGKPRRRPGPPVSGAWIWMVIGLALVAMLFFTTVNNSVEIQYSSFLLLLDRNTDNIQKLSFGSNDRIFGELKDVSAIPTGGKEDPEEFRELKSRFERKGTKKFVTRRWPIQADQELSKKLTDLINKHNLTVEVPDDPYPWIGTVFLFLLPALLLVGLFFFLMPRFRDPMGGSFLSNYVKSPARRYERTKQRVTFDDVAGMQNAKSELQEVVDFLKAPDKFQRLGAQVPRGVLLVGPPGTGKTLLARAVAGEAGVPFFSINGSEFIQMFVGVGASRVRDLFKTAREASPAILFIDEIDAVGRMRGTGVGGGSDEREQTLNQILSEMDGFSPSESVIVMAATNRPDVLDAALLRPGRFDRHVTIDRPNWQGRLAILKVHTRNKPLADDVDLESIARSSIGMTGADLRNLANEAALLATRENKSKLDRSDFARAYDRVLMGPKREEVLTEDDKRRIAYHEAGHALVTWLTPEAEKPMKVTIVPRGRALGVNMTVPEEDRYHHGLDYFKARLVMLMGGRAADRLIYEQPDAGAEMDLRQATRLARYMVTHWGMSERLGPMSFRVGEEHVFLGKEIQEPRDFSEGTAQLIDEEVQKLLREADERALELLAKNRDKLSALVEALLQREELLRDEIEKVLRGEPLPPPESTLPEVRPLVGRAESRDGITVRGDKVPS